MQKGNILVVDDDALYREICSDALKAEGYSIRTASSGNEAAAALNESAFDLVITDLVMPGMDGLELIEHVKRHSALTDVILITGHGSIDSAISALKQGAFDYIRKPINTEELILTVNNCIEKKRLFEENAEIKKTLTLYEAGRAVTATLEMARIYDISIDSILQVLPVEAGFIAIVSGDDYDIKSSRHVSEAQAKCIMAGLKAAHGDVLKLKAQAMGVDGTFGAPDGFSSLLIVPLIDESGPAGVVVLLGRAGHQAFGPTELRSASFMAEHISQGLAHAKQYADARELIFIDSLTSLYNSKYMDVVLDRELKRAERLAAPVTILFIDVDNFKRVNDDNDHVVGSSVLVEVGALLQKCVREIDTVIRYGGDEFVVILVDADCSSGFMVADRIRTRMDKNSFLASDSLNIHVTVSIGVASYPIHARDKSSLIKAADMAMYRAKEVSRNAVYLASLPS